MVFQCITLPCCSTVRVSGKATTQPREAVSDPRSLCGRGSGSCPLLFRAPTQIKAGSSVLGAKALQGGFPASGPLEGVPVSTATLALLRIQKLPEGSSQR